MHQSSAFVRVSRVVWPFHGVPFAVFPVMLGFVVVPFAGAVGYQRAMVPEKFGARGPVVAGVLSAVVRAGVVVGHIRHERLVPFYFFVNGVVLYHPEFFGSSSVYSSLLRRYLGVCVVDVLTSVVMMFPPVFILVVFPEYHFLAAGGMLGHKHVWVPEVVVVTPGGLVSLVMERGFFIFNDVPRGSWCDLTFTLSIRVVQMVLLGQLTRQCIVMR